MPSDATPGGAGLSSGTAWAATVGGLGLVRAVLAEGSEYGPMANPSCSQGPPRRRRGDLSLSAGGLWLGGKPGTGPRERGAAWPSGANCLRLSADSPQEWR